MSQSGITQAPLSTLPANVPTTFTGNTGAGSPVLNTFNIVGSGNITTNVSGNTDTITLAGLTQYNLLVGSSSSTISNISPGTSGQVLTSNGPSSNPSFQNPAIQAWTLLQTQTFSNISSVIFDNTKITSTYSVYAIIFENILHSAGSNMNMTISTDNGNTYLNTGYTSGNWFLSNAGASGAQNTTSAFQLYTGSGGPVQTNNGTLWMYNFGTANKPSVRGEFVVNGGVYWETGFGQNSTTSIVNNVQLASEIGTISGTISLYGIKQ